MTWWLQDQEQDLLVQDWDRVMTLKIESWDQDSCVKTAFLIIPYTLQAVEQFQCGRCCQGFTEFCTLILCTRWMFHCLLCADAGGVTAAADWSRRRCSSFTVRHSAVITGKQWNTVTHQSASVVAVGICKLLHCDVLVTLLFCGCHCCTAIDNQL